MGTGVGFAHAPPCLPLCLTTCLNPLPVSLPVSPCISHHARRLALVLVLPAQGQQAAALGLRDLVKDAAGAARARCAPCRGRAGRAALDACVIQKPVAGGAVALEVRDAGPAAAAFR